MDSQQPARPLGSSYRPDTPISELASWLADPVEAADFPETRLRYRAKDAAADVGLADLGDEEWTAHFGRFKPLPDNLPEPLALKYHGHQFRVYNPDIGDGRGFLFAQMRDSEGRLLDLGTKGSGQTPYSRQGDGRLTLQGAVRELLATEMLGALGVNTSRTFSIIETGEALTRGDEPSPTRSAVLTRLSHGHIRIGTFQRLLALEQTEHMEELVHYCLEQFPGPLPPEDAPGRDQPAVILMHQVVERMADLAASYIASGFVHGVLNTDNMNVSGESFDYGPWRFLPEWNGGFTAAYFDHAGLYAFARQPESIHWNCGQLAVSLRALADSEPLIAALERFGPLYIKAAGRRWCWRLGLKSRGAEADGALIAASERHMREQGMAPDLFFHRHRGGRDADGPLAEAMRGYESTNGNHAVWEKDAPPTLVHSEVERIWAAIASDDDWQPLWDKLDHIARLKEALGTAPEPAGHRR
ncbi:protein adenylyltransferase SelO family protein [Qipengyuania atrilutea]|uniref:YdiU family protein n=1 Tax=Qipengyuania atrilutea TaxID=2744473 RepID=A0A850H503_9SPHN|nr:YdiU family protein [Actirhodobacter atriluteus]NVD45577.1 YdiU family protein [Actirhodobacter atriluteus]